MAAIDQDTELYLPGPPLLEESIHGGTHGASGVEDVIHQHDVLAGDGKLNVGFLHHRHGLHGREIVAIQSDVEGAHRHVSLFDPPDHLPQPLREEYAAPADSDQTKLGGSVILL